jgi:hypothetical protein
MSAHSIRRERRLRRRSPNRLSGRTAERDHHGAASAAPDLVRQCPRPESNQRTRFRKPLLYPLSYGGDAPLCPTGLPENAGQEGLSVYLPYRLL